MYVNYDNGVPQYGGAFYPGGVKTDQLNGSWERATNPTDTYPATMSFALSKVNRIYGTVNAVVPWSITCKYYIRY